MSTRTTRRLSAVVVIGLAAAVRAQFSELITSFETDRDGVATSSIPGSYGDLLVIMFQDPRNSTTTSTFILPDGSIIDNVLVPNAEESAVALVGFMGQSAGANGTAKFLSVFLSWADGTDAARWARVQTQDSPRFPNPAIHLGGKIRIRVRVEDQGFGNSNTSLGIGLLIRETGNDVPQGLNGGLTGGLEFVGVSAVANAGTALPTPAPLPAYTFGGTTSSGDNNFVTLEYDLPALQTSGNVIGWTNQGGDGTLSAANNRGVLEALVLMPTANGRDLAIAVDEVTFEAPVVDPTFTPRLGAPIVAGSTQVNVHDVLSTSHPGAPGCTASCNVSLEIDRSSGGGMFVADETFNVNPAGAVNVSVSGFAALAVGDRLRARQTNPSGTSGYSIVVTVNPPAAFSVTLSIDEDGNGGVTPADFEWVGASGVTGTAGVQGKPVFATCGVWTKYEFSLVPGVEPVIDFAHTVCCGGQLAPDGGAYNVDSFFFTIDPTGPSAGPYEVFVDHIYVLDASNNESVIGDAEFVNPLANFRGQSTHVGGSNSSALSGAGSFDGVQAVRIAWTWPDTALSNTVAPFRPAPSFADTATAVGLYIYVAGPVSTSCNPSGGVRPTVAAPVVGNQTTVRVTGDATATAIQLYVNGAAFGAPATPVAGAANITTSGLLVGNSISATQTVGGVVSQYAVPRADIRALSPSLCGPLNSGAATVTVQSVSTVQFATASLVEVLSNNAVIGSAPGGAATVVVPVSPLVLGATITARQTINGSVSLPSGGIVVTAPTAPPPVVINEVQYEDSLNDDREFVELYNSGGSPVDISGWVLRSSDTIGPPADDNPDYTIPGAPGSNTTVLAAGGFYVIGHSTVPNVNLIITTGFNTAIGSWENDNEVIQLITGTGQVADVFAVELNKGPVAVCPTEGGMWGNMQSVDGTATRPASAWARWIDGLDTDDNGRDFGLLVITPGATNAQPANDIALEDFSAGAPGADVPNFTGSFVNLRYIDPTVVIAANPNAIPASGGGAGGQAAIAWDNSGGGNAVFHVSQARTRNAFALDIYIDAGSSFISTSTTGEFEGWAIGFGTNDSFWNVNTPVDGASGANGDTGLVWRYVKVENANTGTLGFQKLELINENDGGNDGVILFTANAANLTTGWHHLTLSRNEDCVNATFDATDSFSGVVSGNGPSRFSIGYREGIATAGNTLARPPTIDNLQISQPAPLTPVTITSANPPGAGSPYRDVLENTTTGLVAQGIGDAATPNEGTTQYSSIAFTLSGAPCATPTSVAVSCTDTVGNGNGDCPSGAISGSGTGPYTVTLSGPIPVRECTKITVPGVTGTLRYQFLPGDTNLNATTTGQDVLSLVTVINNGTANSNLARYDINRNGTVTGQDVLREVQLINGGAAVVPASGWNAIALTGDALNCP